MAEGCAVSEIRETWINSRRLWWHPRVFAGRDTLSKRCGFSAALAYPNIEAALVRTEAPHD